MENDRFTLEGKTYYQQGRKCGRPGCKCEDGALHGPYWYTRNVDTGKVRYIGRKLPEVIAATRAAHDLLLPDMARARRRLADGFDAVSRLLRGDALSNSDRRILQSLGFGPALVQAPGQPGTQDVILCKGDGSTPDSDTQDGALVPAGGQSTAQDGALVSQRDSQVTQDVILCAARVSATQDGGEGER